MDVALAFGTALVFLAVGFLALVGLLVGFKGNDSERPEGAKR